MDTIEANKDSAPELGLVPGSAESMDICEKLLSHCKGHPHAKVAWPHRVLHEAREEIERLRAEIAAINRRVLVASAYLSTKPQYTREELDAIINGECRRQNNADEPRP